MLAGDLDTDDEGEPKQPCCAAGREHPGENMIDQDALLVALPDEAMVELEAEAEVAIAVAPANAGRW